MLATFALVSSNWMINNFIFNGLGLKSSELTRNPYRPFALSALVELLSYMLTHFLVGRVGRKKPYCVSILMTGLACVSLSFYENRIYRIAMATIGKFFASSSYAICCLFAIELFPTSIRNSCIGVCSMIARLGTITVPFINSLVSIKL
jgi:MFS transporter, OCT family, solute carrier family 22 (organic cation transporter), member 4/5